MAGEPTFVPGVNPTFSLEDDRSPRLRETQFGDGYSQTARDGLNHDPSNVPLRWENLTLAEGAVIWDQITGFGGDEPFFYEVPFFGEILKWTCPKYKRSWPQPGHMNIDITLKQSFVP